MKVQIPFSRRIQELINRNNIQIRSLKTLDENLLKLYRTGQKKAILIYRSKVHEVQIHLIGARHIKVTDINLSIFMRPGDLVFIILEGDEGKRYVLQTSVVELFVDRFKLKILDPRSNERVKLSKPCRISFLQVPPLLSVELEKENMQIIRETELVRKGRPVMLSDEEAPAEPTPPTAVYEIIDFFTEKDRKKKKSAMYKSFLEHKSIPAKLIDISRGGMRIQVKQGLAKKLENYFLYVKFDSSELTGENEGGPHSSIKIMAFAIIRSFKATPEGDNLHLMFFSQLPEEAVQYFPAQEQNSPANS